MQPKERVGTILGAKYKITRLLGAGGMGAVFEATNTKTERRVAIKIMLAGEANPELAARFLREARAASRITHPNVVDVLDMGEDDDGTPFIVQEFLVGSDLRRLLDERRSLSIRDTLEIITPVMSALCAAHRQRVVHRDLKPENIFLERSGGSIVPKLIDFGLARIDTGDGLTLTKSGAAMGTPYYMSPEQAKGESGADGVQTDIWAMAVVIFEMLAGRGPFEGDSYNALMWKILTGEIPRLDVLVPRIPKTLAEVVAGGLERDLAKRYPSMANFLGALLDCPGIGDETARRSLRTLSGDFGNEITSVDTSLATTQKRPPRISLAPSRDGTLRPNTSTLGRSAKEISAPVSRPSGSRGFLWVGAIALVGLGGFGAAALAMASRRTTTVPAISPPLVLPAASIPAEPPFNVAVTTYPPTASIMLDQVSVGTGAFAATLPHDGREHSLRVSAAGFEPQTIGFRNTPPPAVVELVAIIVGAPLPRRTGGIRRSSAAGRATPAMPTSSPAVLAVTTAPPSPSVVPVPPSVNGAPILGQE